MYGGPFIGLGLPGAVLLIASAAGYLVCSIAKKEQGTLKTTGYIIGVGIIVLAGLLILNGLMNRVRFYKMMKCEGGMGSMSMMQGKGKMMKDMKDMLPMPAPQK
jgi:hypothetical protein